MRKLEEQVGRRYLTHESDDARWQSFRRAHNHPSWRDLGHTGGDEIDGNNIGRSNFIYQHQDSFTESIWATRQLEIIPFQS